MLKDIIQYAFIYFVLWWIVLFVFLPLWAKPSEVVLEGNDPGAPEKPHLLKKFLINSIATAILSYLALKGWHSGWLDQLLHQYN